MDATFQGLCQIASGTGCSAIRTIRMQRNRTDRMIDVAGLASQEGPVFFD